MSLYYTHVLIPRRADYKAAPGQVADFFAALVELGVTSLDAGYRISTYTEQANWAEQHRVGQDPATGETSSLSVGSLMSERSPTYLHIYKHSMNTTSQ